LTASQVDIDSDPTLAPWLFVILSQVQIFLSFIGYTSPALKKTMIDLATNFGTIYDSQAGSTAHNGDSFAMQSFGSAKNMGNGARQRSYGGKRTAPLPGTSTKTSTLAKREADSDGDSQKGIMRQDEYEISYVSRTMPRDVDMWDAEYTSAS
jgi:hypothetical protein